MNDEGLSRRQPFFPVSTIPDGHVFPAGKTSDDEPQEGKRLSACRAETSMYRLWRCSVSQQLLQGGNSERLWGLSLHHVCAGKLAVPDVLLAHELLEETHDLVHDWSLNAHKVSDALVHGNTLRNVLCEVTVGEIWNKSSCNLLHRASEALVAVAGLDRGSE